MLEVEEKIKDLVTHHDCVWRVPPSCLALEAYDLGTGTSMVDQYLLYWVPQEVLRRVGQQVAGVHRSGKR